jgi:hypothetical protein
MATETYKPIEIAKPGKAVAVSGVAFEFTEPVLRDLSESYDPSLHEAPIVVGHPKLDAPAYGSIGEVVYDPASQRLDARPSHVDPDFAEAVNRKLYRAVSLSMYLPDSPSNPKPGHHYLRHVGFLGAHPPAIKGLRQVSFGADEEGVVTFGEWDERITAGLFRRLRDWLIGSFGQDAADKVLPDYEIQSLADAAAEESARRAMDYHSQPAGFSEPEPTGESAVTQTTDKTAEFAEREAALSTRETELQAREQRLRDQEKAADRARSLDFAEQLARDGKILPRDKAGLAEFHASLPADGALEFGEGDGAVKTTGRAWFEEFVKRLPKQVDFGEFDQGGADEDATLNFAAPPEGTVDPAGLALHEKAVAYQRENQCDYRTAVAAVSGR